MPHTYGLTVRIPVKLNSDSGICEHHFRKVCGQGFCEQKLSFEGRHLFDSPNKPAAKRSAAVVDPGHWGSRDFPSKNDKVLWRPRRPRPPEGYYFFGASHSQSQ